MPQRHAYTYRVSYADTDRMDRVYYANYLEICERARTEFLRDIGHPYRAFEEQGFFFPVRSCQIRYYGGAVYDDELLCQSHVSRMRHATLSITTEISREDVAKPLVIATVELACVGSDWKPCVIPEPMRQALKPYADD